MTLLTELINSVLDQIYSEEDEDFKKYYLDTEYHKRIYNQNPKCYITLKMYGNNDPLLLPICNRYALHDKKVLLTTYRLLQRLKAKLPFDQDELEYIELKLSRLLIKYSKPNPKSSSYAATKAKVTRQINDIFKRIEG